MIVGGYGLFGAVYSVTLRLTHRRKLEQVVKMITAKELVDAVAERVATGFLYGDFQFAIDSDSPDFLTKGVFSCYRPVSDSAPILEDQRALTPDYWQALLVLAHTDKSCYPQFAEFLALKRRYDPDELFHSDWYRHYAALFPAA